VFAVDASALVISARRGRGRGRGVPSPEDIGGLDLQGLPPSGSSAFPQAPPTPAVAACLMHVAARPHRFLDPKTELIRSAGFSRRCTEWPVPATPGHGGPSHPPVGHPHLRTDPFPPPGSISHPRVEPPPPVTSPAPPAVRDPGELVPGRVPGEARRFPHPHQRRPHRGRVPGPRGGREVGRGGAEGPRDRGGPTARTSPSVPHCFPGLRDPESRPLVLSHLLLLSSVERQPSLGRHESTQLRTMGGCYPHCAKGGF